MKYQKECEHCGHQISAYSHKVNKSLLSAFGKLVEYFYQHRKGARLSDIDLTVNQYSNFQKLQYFGIIRKDKDSDGWIPTRYGVEFWEGRERCKDTAGTFGRSVLPYDHEAWDTHSRKPKDLFIWEFDDEQDYKQKSEYQIERSKRESLFPHDDQ